MPGAIPSAVPRSMLTTWPVPAIMESSPMSTTYPPALPVGGDSRVTGACRRMRGTLAFS